MTIVQRALLSLAASALTGAAIGTIANRALKGRGALAHGVALLVCLPASGAIGEAVGQGVFALSGMSSAELRDGVSRLAYRGADALHRAVSA